MRYLLLTLGLRNYTLFHGVREIALFFGIYQPWKNPNNFIKPGGNYLENKGIENGNCIPKSIARLTKQNRIS